MSGVQDNRQPLLVVTRNLPPLVGGMERLVWHIVDELVEEYRLHVVGPKGCGRYLPQDMTVSEVSVSPLPLYFLKTLALSLWLAFRLKPAKVFAGSGLTAPFAWLAARLSGARCLIYLHGLDIAADSRLYQALWLPFLRRADVVLVNSRFTASLAEKAGIDQLRIKLLHPGVTLPGIENAGQLRKDFRTAHALGDRPLMLYVGRIVPRKGLLAFVENVLPAVIRRCPEARLLVVGDEPAQALLKSSGETSRVRQSLEKLELEQSVMFLGSPDDETLSQAYFAADVLVFPVQQQAHDNEGFGMVAVEAAAHGLPTVAFAAGGVPDAVADQKSGRLLPAGDYPAMVEAIAAYLSGDEEAVNPVSCREFAKALSWQRFGERLRGLFSEPY